MKVEEIVKMAEERLVPPMDALGKELLAHGADPLDGMIAISNQLILQARFIMRIIGGREYEAKILYTHADDAVTGEP